jgi:hypothetical protein
MYTQLWSEVLKRKELVRPKHRWEYDVKMNLKETRRRECTGFIWLRRGTGGGFL